MSEESKIDPKHSLSRRILRTLGPIIASLGLLLTVIGFGSFFTSFGTFEPPRYFWCVFLGLPLLFVGVALCMFAYLGSVTRYMSGEAAPVQKDTFNYLAEGTKEGVRTFATAVGEGIATGLHSSGSGTVRCPNCQADNDRDAKFCKHCGTALARAV
jgi:zinc-ribbon domain